MNTIEKSARDVIDEILDHPDSYLKNSAKREDNLYLLKACSKYCANNYRNDEIEKLVQ